MMKSDVELQRDVMDELAWEPSIEAISIKVSVNKGVVMLAGKVSSYPEKLTAEYTAQRVAGVLGLIEAIAVDLPPGLSKYKDSEIKQVAQTILKWNVAVPDDKIMLKVEKGCITLEGEVTWQYQKIALETALRYIKGVTAIVNNIGIVPRVAAVQARIKIEAALKRNAWVDTREIEVAADSGKVTLKGISNTWKSYQEAERSAWALPGVRMVKNRLQLAE
ncbi:MAG: BON domain-containing protein [Methylophilaceae bacterium]